MHTARARLLDPLNLVGFATMFVVAYTMLRLPPPDRTYALLAVGAFVALSVLMDVVNFETQQSKAGFALSCVLAGTALIACWFGSHTGAAQILLVVWIARASFYWRQKPLMLMAVLLNLAVYFILSARGIKNPVLVTLLYACFQAFAALLSTYSRRIEEARDHLAEVNADLLATRALLAETSRSNERFRVARDLHDVAGHKLTALRLNLRALAGTEPDKPALHDAEQLSAELLSDIRGVVHALRADEGLDITPALAALAAPFKKPRVETRVEANVHITDARVAEAVVRCVQEAITNAAKHGNAELVRVSLSQSADQLVLEIEDDGRHIKHWKAGHGLQGMHERVEEAGGQVASQPGEHGGMKIDARFPA